MAKKKSTDKGEELYWRAKQSLSFERDLKVFKKKHHLPDVEKIGKEKLEKVLTQKYIDSIYEWESKHTGYISDRITFLQKYGFPIANEGGAMDPIVCNQSPVYSHFEIEPDLWTGNEYVKLVIRRGATRKEAIDFIKRNWRNIDPLLNAGGKKKPRIRKITKKQEDELILKMWQLPTKELLKPGEAKTDKELIVARRLEEVGIYRTSDAIKAVVSRMRRLAKVGIW